jgi:hypothetical protein
MPVQASYDVLMDPPRALDEPFALAARRITATWLETRDVTASADDLRLAARFLQRVGLTLEPLPGLLVRLVSERGHETIMSREAAVMTAIRCIAGLDAPRTTRPIARAA